MLALIDLRAYTRQPYTHQVCATAIAHTNAAPYACRHGVKEPLAIGDVLLSDSTLVKGFVGEAYGVAGCKEVSSYGGWRTYVSERIMLTES